MERKTITVNDEIGSIVRRGADMWPELAHNYSGLVCKIIADWDRVRASGGGKMETLQREIRDVRERVDRLGEQIEDLRTGKALIVNARTTGCDCVAGFDDDGMEIKQ